MRKVLERMTKIGGLVGGGIAVGVGVYYNLSLVTLAGLAAATYPVGMALRTLVDEEDRNYANSHKQNNINPNNTSSPS